MFSPPAQIYLLAPKGALGRFIKKPFIKFICHTASYLTFLFMLLLASQHIARTNLHMQGPPPTIVEWMILPWVLGTRALPKLCLLAMTRQRKPRTASLALKKNKLSVHLLEDGWNGSTVGTQREVNKQTFQG